MIFHFHEFLICFWISHFVNDKKSGLLIILNQKPIDYYEDYLYIYE